MKKSSLLLILIIAFGLNYSCSAQEAKTNSKDTKVSAAKVEVYYFHYTRRCATCNAVEEVTKNAVTEFYGNEVKFHEFNLDETNGEAKGEVLGISGQTLLITSGDTQINLTSEAFLNARTNPEKLKQIIKEKIDPLL